MVLRIFFVRAVTRPRLRDILKMLMAVREVDCACSRPTFSDLYRNKVVARRTLAVCLTFACLSTLVRVRNKVVSLGGRYRVVLFVAVEGTSCASLRAHQKAWEYKTEGEQTRDDATGGAFGMPREVFQLSTPSGGGRRAYMHSNCLVHEAGAPKGRSLLNSGRS